MMKDRPVYIIAEAGVNHNGSVDLARQLVDAALDAGADAVKFQTFQSSRLVSELAPKAGYQKKTTGRGESQKQMLEKLELGYDDQKALYQYTRMKGLDFLSSPFDVDSIVFLRDLGLDTIKVPSGEITNLPYLEVIGGGGWKILLSTGMAYLEEIVQAVDILVRSGTRKQDIIVLHCNTQYPTPMADVNLRAMPALGASLGLDYGYSDHTRGIEVPVAAVALGARVIEKHFTLDPGMKGPDHSASLSPAEFASMVRAIRNSEAAMGCSAKIVSPSEQENRLIVRKSIVAARPIVKNETFTIENLTTKRPGNGISPMEWHEVLGKKAQRDYLADEMIES